LLRFTLVRLGLWLHDLEAIIAFFVLPTLLMPAADCSHLLTFAMFLPGGIATAHVASKNVYAGHALQNPASCDARMLITCLADPFAFVSRCETE